MNNVFCHIVGLNDKIKSRILELLKSPDFNFHIIDLDDITQKIINDKNILIYDKG